MASVREPRRIARQGWDTEAHLGAIDTDLDDLYGRLGRMEGKIDRMLWAMLGVIITAATATLVGALNLIYARAG